jgi:hypothetical protein
MTEHEDVQQIDQHLRQKLPAADASDVAICKLCSALVYNNAASVEHHVAWHGRLIRDRKSRRFIWFMVLPVDIAAVILGPILDLVFHQDAAFQIAYGIAAIVTFLGLLPVAMDAELQWFQFRELVASGFVVTYLLLVTAAAFFHNDLPEGNITPAFVNNFTTLTAVVVGAYFTARTAEKITDTVTASKNKPASGTGHPGNEEDR